MLFLTYDFVWYALLFFPIYFIAPGPNIRLAVTIIGGGIFQYYYGGWTSVVPVLVLTVATFVTARVQSSVGMLAAILLCLGALVTYKYTTFLAVGVIGSVYPELGATLRDSLQTFLPVTIPLGISFFVFEFVHYLNDVRQGGPPIRRFSDFLAFVLFWPTMVAGPIKRYQQFLPSLRAGLAAPTSTDAMIGLARVAVGFLKKWTADNITGWCDFAEQQFDAQSHGFRWLFVAALSFRILLDFSGYSDMAIGYARIMGIVVPENFNWPYLAQSPMDFWQRWHISLSQWIRDYVYIPLGGSRHGVPRRAFNALIAMALCGLWHGPDWNFVAWGFYHGCGLAGAGWLQTYWKGQTKPSNADHAEFSVKGAILLKENRRFTTHGKDRFVAAATTLVSWALTMIFVCIGWLLFFYPVHRALAMAVQLFTW